MVGETGIAEGFLDRSIIFLISFAKMGLCVGEEEEEGVGFSRREGRAECAIREELIDVDDAVEKERGSHQERKKKKKKKSRPIIGSQRHILF